MRKPTKMAAMRSRFFRPLLLAALAASLAFPPQLSTSAAQATPQSRERQGPAIRVGVALVNLFATVRGKNKRLVADLTREEFRIFEDGQEQKVEFFSRETSLPITLGILIDTSGSQRRVLGAEQEAASRFVERVLRQGDLGFVVSFDVDVDLLSDFTGDADQIERAIRRTRIHAPQQVTPGPIPLPARGTSLYDAIYLGCREKLAGEAGRKALVILTDAQDYGSKVRLEEALEIAQRTDTVIHILGVADPIFYGGGYFGEGVAKKLAGETGGRAIFVHSEKKLEEAFDQISEELRSQYTLGYYPANTSRDGKFRKIKIELARPGLKALARRGYYAPKD